MFLKILTVAALATFELYVAIPTGFAMKLSPWIILSASIFGGLLGVFVTAFLGDKIRHFFSKNKQAKKEPAQYKHPMMHKLWEKYGVIGLGFLGTVSIGAPVSIAVGVSLNADIKKLITWCCIGVITRCAVFTAIGHFGLKIF